MAELRRCRRLGRPRAEQNRSIRSSEIPVAFLWSQSTHRADRPTDPDSRGSYEQVSHRRIVDCRDEYHRTTVQVAGADRPARHTTGTDTIESSERIGQKQAQRLRGRAWH